MSFKDRWHKEKARKAARKAARREKNAPLVGLGWYSRGQWEALTQVVPNRSDLDDTYEEWEAQATEALQMLSAQGIRAVKVEVDVDELVEWCKNTGRQPNSEARADFVNSLLRKRSRDSEAPGA